jgi:GT2 family glycosyltransferase
MEIVTISVIIPTRNRTECLRKCLRALLPQIERNSEVVETIVCDDGESVETRAMLESEFRQSHWYEGPKRGPAANRNLGAKAAKGQWLVFLDDDCIPDANLIRSYIDAIKDNSAVYVLEGRIVADREKRHPLEECPINSEGGNLWSCNFAIRRNSFLEIGGFDESFPHPAGEDWELAYRIRRARLQLVFVHEAFVVHCWRRLSMKAYLLQQRRLLEANIIMIRKHPELRDFFSLFQAAKDVLRYYARGFIYDLKNCGIQALIYQPVFLWVRCIRIIVLASVQSRAEFSDRINVSLQ